MTIFSQIKSFFKTKEKQPLAEELTDDQIYEKIESQARQKALIDDFESDKLLREQIKELVQEELEKVNKENEGMMFRREI